MIRLLIVDDEEEIRQGIRDVIDWSSHDILICGEASNGQDVLDRIEEFNPDIMLVDIRMPIMNGLKLIEALYQKQHHVKSIILSGYDDFSYAQSALKYGAVNYLLKPCRREELLEEVLKVKSAFENEAITRATYKKLESNFKEYIPLIKAKYLPKLLLPGLKEKDSIQQFFDLYKIGLNLQETAVSIIRMDNFTQYCEGASNSDIELMKFAVMNIALECIGNTVPCELFEYNDDIIIIANYKSSDYSSTILPIFNKVKDNIQKYLNFTVSIGIGRIYNDLCSTYQSYFEALKSIEAKFVIGDNTIINYEDISHWPEKEFNYPLNEERDILMCIKSGKGNELELKLECFLNSLNPSTISKGFLVKSTQALVLSLIHLCLESNIDVQDLFGSGFTILDSLQKMDSLKQLKEKIISTAKIVYDSIENKKKSNKIIEAVLKILEQSYNEDISLENIANQLFINSSYLSFLFKNVMGTNFIDYINKIRIEKACEMMLDVRLKTYEIAYKVGFSDEKYFGQLFKKRMGMTPTQYRETARR